ncbi:hypothetical protein M8C13_38550 [Crossiella sp. SN42]|uniref:terpene synthase family protein n=1 Tax=Crossiella sp. SN42 TaxID=2944808 RepID=UPI00207C685B|nr:hypothetical protein [Crossiella sp. SN42]MCO1581666.1 hypothetical protein [Crossiella sp. SN42]
MTTPIILPPYYFPFESQLHPDAEEINQLSLVYMDKYRLYGDEVQRDRITNSHAGLCAAYQCADLPAELVQLNADLLMWAFCYDDEICDEPPGGLRLERIARTNLNILRAAESIEQPPNSDERYAAALHDIRIRFSTLISPMAGDQLARHLGDYINMEMHKSAYKVCNVTPNLSEVVAMRLWSGGATMFPWVCLLINGQATDLAVLSNRRLRALVETAALISGWDNDIYSVKDETTRPANRNELNIVDVIGKERKLDLQQAIEVASVMRDRLLTLYLHHRDQLLQQNADLYQPYATALEGYLRGHLDWAFSSGRYACHGPNAPTRFSGFTDVPRDNDLTPLPIDSIQWWWRI